jgi:hypothetical protein
MKKIKLLLLLLMLTGASAYSQLQQIKIVSFTVKNQLPAVIDNWGTIPGSLLLVAQLPPNVSVKGIRLMVQIKGGGAIICSNNSTGGMQVDEFTTRTFSANELTGTLQGCHDLKEGSYSICVQFYNVDRVAISNEVCKEFSVETPREPEYTPPTLINPENGKVFTEAELSRPVTFRWTPLVPKPQQAVTYRLKVWQLMQGQNSTEAMRTNQPIVTKDVDNITQAVVNGIYTGPCRPPYLCDYVWQVQALNREGKPIGKNEGKSEPYTFKVETNTTTYTAPQLIAPNDGKAFTANEMAAPVMFRWTPVVPKPQSVIYRLKVWQLMQGQSASQAMRTNPPIVTKDVDNITQAVVTGIYTGPCRPPYLCDYVWQVQAVDREDHPIGSNEGKSELWAFKVGENGATECTAPKLQSPADAKSFAAKDASGGISFRWTPLVPKPSSPVTYRLKVWQLMQGQSGSQAMRTNKPIVTKDIADITEATISNIYTGPCRPPYLCDYIWEVQALTREGKPACATNEGKSEAFTFKVQDDAATECSSPKLESPVDAKSFAPKDASGGISFRWTPVVPKPQQAVTYRLKVWQLMQGQSGSQAMRTNKPIVTKDIADITEATISNIYTGPCRPPYLCDYIWEVQALTREGKPACAKNEGKSEAFSFKIQNNIDIQIDSLKVGCCEKGVQSIYIKVRNNLATPVKVVAIKYKVNGAGAAITFTPTSPTLPQTIVGNGFVVFTGFIECNPAINFLKFLVDAEDVADPDNKETEVKSDTLNCICTACKDIKIQPNEKDKPTITSTAITQNISFVTGPGKVKTVKMDLVWFEFIPESDDCLVCTTPSSQMGNFSSGTLNGTGGSGGGTHNLVWNFSPPKDMNGGVALQYNISYPKMVACCGAKAKWCIRYTVTYENCITCSVVVCNYEASIKGCNK